MTTTAETPRACWNEVMIVAPTGRDGELIANVFERSGIRARRAKCLDELSPDLSDCGAIVLAEEILEDSVCDTLLAMLRSQPVWSDMPVFILAAENNYGMLRKEHIEKIYNTGNATILQRPVPMMSLVSSVRAALRARSRQFEVRELLLQREREVRERDEFLAMLAHELRNPLAPIRNGIHIWKLENCTPQQRDKARDSMERQVQHLARMVDDLLDVARVSRGRITLRKERLDLVELVRKGVDDHQPAVQAAGLTLDVKLPTFPVWVDADKTRLTQVLGNLVNNAGKFTDKGGRITVDLHARPLDKSAVLTVWDTGIGMTREMLNRVFQPFSQADKTLDRHRGGLGLGLVLARRMIELHNGRIEANSEGLGRGSHFTVTLPAQYDTRQQQAPFDLRPETHKRVLLIEDNIDSAETLKLMLELTGHQVEVAHNGHEGINKVRDFEPQVILCDIGLPGMDGYEVARKLRDESLAASCVLIALTGYGQEEDQRKAREAGFDVHLTKPVDPHVLTTMVGK